MAIVVPPPDGLKETAQLLLSLANSPADVRTVSNGTQFDVPDELADAYHDRLNQPVTKTRRGSGSRASRKD